MDDDTLIKLIELRISVIQNQYMKKRSERRKHCAPAAVPHRRESAMAVVRQSQNFSPPQTPSRGRRTAKI